MVLKLLLVLFSLNVWAADVKYPNPKLPQIHDSRFRDAATNPSSMRAMVKAYGTAYIRAYIQEFTSINHVENRFPHDLISQYNSQIDAIPDSAIISYGKNTLQNNSGKAQMDLVARGLYENVPEGAQVSGSPVSPSAGGEVSPTVLAGLMDRINQLDAQLSEIQKANSDMQNRIRAIEGGHPLPSSAPSAPMSNQGGDWGKWVALTALLLSLFAVSRSMAAKKSSDKKSFKVY